MRKLPLFTRNNKFYLVRSGIMYPIDTDLFIKLAKQTKRTKTCYTCTKYYIGDNLVLIHQYYQLDRYSRFDNDFEEVMYGKTE